jgi:hypothetical protein
LPRLRDVRADQELDPTYVPHHYLAMLLVYGRLHETAGHLGRADEVYRRAVAWAPWYPPAAAALAAVRRRIAASDPRLTLSR